MNDIEFSLRVPVNCKIIAIIWLICAVVAYNILPEHEWTWIGSLIISQVWLLWASIQETIIVRTIMKIKHLTNGDPENISEIDNDDYYYNNDESEPNK